MGGLEAEDRLDSLEKRVAVLEAELRGGAVMDAVVNLLNEDGHQWSARPCSTCRTITGLVGRSFGCVAYAIARASAASQTNTIKR